jgi:hypothetical protein
LHHQPDVHGTEATDAFGRNRVEDALSRIRPISAAVPGRDAVMHVARLSADGQRVAVAEAGRRSRSALPTSALRLSLPHTADGIVANEHDGEARGDRAPL